MIISELPYKRGEVFTGEYRVHQPQRCISSNGTPYTAFKIEDMSGYLKAYAWQGQFHGNIALHEQDKVKLEGRLRLHGENWISDVLKIETLPQPESNPIHLIPARTCPLADVLPKLCSQLDTLKVEPLRRFVANVLSNDDIAFPFISAPASLRHHHNYPGGLVEHSLECIESVSRFTQFPDEVRELGMVACLFHDIGKIRTLNSNMKRTWAGNLLAHDALTLEILSTYLQGLDREWLDGGIALRYLWSWRNHYKSQANSLMLIAEAVASADRISSGLNAEAQAYAGHPDWHQFAKLNDSSRFWRPKIAA